MSELIIIPKVRQGSDVKMTVTLTDNGVAVDWTSLSDIVAMLYSNEQRVLSGQCRVEVDSEDSTKLICNYDADSPEFVGVNSLVVRCTYLERKKTYDKKVLEFVATTDELDGQPQVIEDPELDVTINVEDVSTSLLDNAIAAAFDAALAATEATEVAEEDHERAEADHTIAAADHTQAASDHTTAAADHSLAAADHTQAGQDHTRAAGDHDTAVADHTLAGTDHSTAAADHTQAASDHTRAESDHTQAASDHTTAVADHTLAGTDHNTAVSDHTQAASDHTTAASDHNTAAADHTVAAADHTQALADHQVMQGYDTRLTKAETDISQLGQEKNTYELIGAGNTYVSKDIPLISGHTYLLSFNNPDWGRDATQTASGQYLLHVYAIGDPIVDFVSVKGISGVVNKHYTFTVPAGYSTVKVGLRANSEVNVLYSITDVTELSRAKDIWLYTGSSTRESITINNLYRLHNLAWESWNINETYTLYNHLYSNTYLLFDGENISTANSPNNVGDKTILIFYSSTIREICGGVLFESYIANNAINPKTPIVSGDSYWLFEAAKRTFTLSGAISIICGDVTVAIPANTSVAVSSSSTTRQLAIVVNSSLNGLEVISASEANNRIVLTEFVQYGSPENGRFVNITSSLIPIANRRSNYFITGFTVAPINIDNVNKKFRWDNYLYFRHDGIAYSVYPGELDFSSYEGGQTCLALVLIPDYTAAGYGNSVTATIAIRANGPVEENNFVNDYLVAWFFRSGSSWQAGPVVSVYSELPFTIDGKTDIDRAVSEAISDISVQKQDFPIGPLVNYAITKSGLGDPSTQRASQETLFAVPHDGCKITCHFSTPKLEMGIRSGSTSDNLSTNHYWMKDGDSYVIPSGHTYYRVSFAIEGLTSSTYEEISAADVMSTLATGLDSVVYETPDSDFLVRANDSDAFVKAVMYNFDSVTTGQGLQELPMFAHITDAHGDITRISNAVKYAKYLGVDALLATGDFVANNYRDNFAAIEDVLMQNDDIPTLFCRGNHENYDNQDINFDVYTKYYAALASKYEYQLTDDKTYYYKDFAGKKIRVISVNPYENSVASLRNVCAYSQAQIDWFIATLKSTPQDYGIIVIQHSPESHPYTSPSIVPIAGKDKFFLDGSPLYWSTPQGASICPLMQIVETFISRSVLSTTFTESMTDAGSVTISISADFTSGVNTGVEFIAWICGHEHLDLVGEYDRNAYNLTHRQLVLDVTCATALYGPDSYPYLNNVSDLPRGGLGVVQDAITIYAIDRQNKQVRIARCGSRFSNKLVERDCMVVSYVDSLNP